MAYEAYSDVGIALNDAMSGSLQNGTERLSEWNSTNLVKPHEPQRAPSNPEFKGESIKRSRIPCADPRTVLALALTRLGTPRVCHAAQALAN